MKTLKYNSSEKSSWEFINNEKAEFIKEGDVQLVVETKEELSCLLKGFGINQAIITTEYSEEEYDSDKRNGFRYTTVFKSHIAQYRELKLCENGILTGRRVLNKVKINEFKDVYVVGPETKIAEFDKLRNVCIDAASGFSVNKAFSGLPLDNSEIRLIKDISVFVESFSEQKLDSEFPNWRSEFHFYRPTKRGYWL